MREIWSICVQFHLIYITPIASVYKRRYEHPFDNKLHDIELNFDPFFFGQMGRHENSTPTKSGQSRKLFFCRVAAHLKGAQHLSGVNLRLLGII
jgi:hypothetical protein